MWFSLSVGATGRLVRPAYRTPFGVDKPTIQGCLLPTSLGVSSARVIIASGKPQESGSITS
jgi:hypothetical protein